MQFTDTLNLFTLFHVVEIVTSLSRYSALYVWTGIWYSVFVMIIDGWFSYRTALTRNKSLIVQNWLAYTHTQALHYIDHDKSMRQKIIKCAI